QLWSGVVDPSRAIDWSTSAGVPGGIPSGSYTQCGSTIAAGSSATTINNALSACTSGDVVLLGAGAFNLNAGILMNKSGVVLRGAGADQTKLIFSGSNSCHGFFGAICMIDTSGQDIGSATTTNVTGGLTKGSTSVTVSSATGLSVGMYVGMDQLDDG